MAVDARQRRWQEFLIDLRETAVRAITEKNRLRATLDHLTGQLDSADPSQRNRIEGEIARTKSQIAEAENKVERLKSEVEAQEIEVRMADYPPENRERATLLMQELNRIVAERFQTPPTLKTLNQKMYGLMADIHESRTVGDDARAGALVAQLDDVLEELEAAQPTINAERADLMRNLVGHLEDELDQLKVKESRSWTWET